MTITSLPSRLGRLPHDGRRLNSRKLVAIALVGVACAGCGSGSNNSSGATSTVGAAPSVGSDTSVLPPTSDDGDSSTGSSMEIGLSADNAPTDEAGVVAAMTPAIDELPWPETHKPTAQALWNSKMAPAAADTALGPADGIMMVEAWNACAWSLEASESVAAKDQAKIDAAAGVLATIESQYQYTSFGGALADIGTEAKQGSAATADELIAANECEDWPTE